MATSLTTAAEPRPGPPVSVVRRRRSPWKLATRDELVKADQSQLPGAEPGSGGALMVSEEPPGGESGGLNASALAAAYLATKH